MKIQRAVRSTSLAFIVAFCVFVFAPSGAFAQSLAAGLPPYGSFQPGGFDTVNRQNENVLFAIPIVHSPGRGMNFDFSLIYNTSFWSVQGGAIPYWSFEGEAGGFGPWGWSATKFAGGSVSYQTAINECSTWDDNGDPETEYTELNYNFIYTDGSGTAHNMGISYYSSATDCGFSPSSPYVGTATDGSGITYNPITNIVGFADGTSLVGTSFVDPNGNKITPSTSGSETDWTDTVGRTVLKIIVSSPTETLYEYLDPTGAYQTTTVKYQLYETQTNFGCSGVPENNWEAYLPYEIDLPNGTKYQMTYEATPGYSGYYTGRLKRLTLPTGGYYEYDYTGSNGGVNCTDGSVMNMTRTYYDGSNTAQWTYARSSVSGLSGVTTITAPQLPYDTVGSLNQSVFTFNSLGQESQEKYYQGAATGTPLRQIDETWATNGSPATSVTTLETGQQSEVDTTYDGLHNLTLVKEYDLGASAPGSLIRETDMTYANPGGYRLTQKLVKDGSGNLKYREDRAYDETTPTCVSSVTQHDDTHFGCSFNSRGNLTTLTTYTDPTNTSTGIPRNFTYNTLGNTLTAQVNCCQQKQFNYSATTQYTFPDSVVSGPSTGTQLTKYATYNAYTGGIHTYTDENGQVTTFAYDVYKRLTTVTRPDSTVLTTAYDDSAFTVTSAVPIDSSHSSKQVVAVDGLNRPVTTTLEDSGATVYSIVQTKYDPLGGAYKTSNPYTSSASYWTETRVDGLGRAIKTILPDSSYSTASFSGNCATMTDPVGKARKSCSDGLGHMSKVYEDPSSLNYETDYTYNLLDTLTQVSQGSQTRTYVYDGMGRVTSSTTPEAGTVSFQYNAYDLLTQRTDARSVVTNYTYDTLNRVTGVSYTIPGGSAVAAMPNNCDPAGGSTYTANVCYYYDAGGSSVYALGRLTSMTDGVGGETYSYDQLGRSTQLQKVIGGTTYTTAYTYNLANELAQITYPSGRVVKESYDGIGRLCGVGASGSACSSGTTYASGISYNAAQQVTGVTFGNGVTASFGYSADRLQMTSLAYANSSSTLFSLSYSYGSSGSNNGIITGITDNVQSGRTASYSYDALNRISAASTSGSTAYPAWGLNWTYDQYGNRTTQTIPSSPSGLCSFGCPTDSLAASTSTNRITNSGFSYDASGNITNDAFNAFVYDAENRAVSASNTSSSGAYLYDGNGLRVKKSVPMSSPTTTTVYIFSDSRVIAEYVNGAAVGSPTAEYLYAGNILLATVGSAGTHYHHADHLSARLTTDSSGNSAGEQGHLPFGESWYSSGTTTKYQFTNYEHDAESGNDYALARHYDNRLGRFTSPDPLAGSTSNPQSLNRYTYVQNNPINFTDPSGMVCSTANGGCDPVNYPCYVKLMHDGSNNGDEMFGGPNDGALGLLDNTAALDSGCGDDGYDDDPNADPCTDWGHFESKGGCGGGGGGTGGGGTGGGGGGGSPVTNKLDCSKPPVQPPQAPLGVSVDANMGLLQAMSAINTQVSGSGFVGYLETNAELASMVRPGGSMDYKTQGEQFVDFGNFNFGAVCQAAGDSLYACQNGAGAAHITQYVVRKAEGHDPTYGGQGVPVVKSPYGDQAGDAAQISDGYNYASSGGALHNALWYILCKGINF